MSEELPSASHPTGAPGSPNPSRLNQPDNQPDPNRNDANKVGHRSPGSRGDHLDDAHLDFDDAHLDTVTLGLLAELSLDETSIRSFAAELRADDPTSPWSVDELLISARHLASCDHCDLAAADLLDSSTVLLFDSPMARATTDAAYNSRRDQAVSAALMEFDADHRVAAPPARLATPNTLRVDAAGKKTGFFRNPKAKIAAVVALIGAPITAFLLTNSPLTGNSASKVEVSNEAKATSSQSNTSIQQRNASAAAAAPEATAQLNREASGSDAQAPKSAAAPASGGATDSAATGDGALAGRVRDKTAVDSSAAFDAALPNDSSAAAPAVKKAPPPPAPATSKAGKPASPDINKIDSQPPATEPANGAIPTEQFSPVSPGVALGDLGVIDTASTSLRFFDARVSAAEQVTPTIPSSNPVTKKKALPKSAATKSLSPSDIVGAKTPCSDQLNGVTYSATATIGGKPVVLIRTISASGSKDFVYEINGCQLLTSSNPA